MIEVEKDKERLVRELRELRTANALLKSRESEWRRAEHALRVSEGRFRSLFEQSPISIQVFSPGGRTLEVNPAFEKLWGLKGDTLKDYNVLRDRQLEERGIMPYIRKGFAGEAAEVPVAEYNPAAAGYPGRSRWVKAFIYPVKDESGVLQQVVLMHIDITDQVQAQQALRDSRQRLRAILDSSPAVIFMKDRQGRFLLVNRRFEEVVHLREEAVLGKTDYDIFPAQIADSVRANDAKVLETGVPLEIEEVVPQDDGVHTYISIKSPVPDERGVPYAVCGISTDITDRKQDREKLRQSNVKLESTITSIVNAISKMVELRDPYTAGHQRHVSQLASAMAREMGFSREKTEWIRIAGLIHDIGKIYIPAEILSKPTRLTPFEFEMIKMHPKAGYDFIRIIDFPWPVAKVVYQHHERIDGSGYPQGLKEPDIPIETRIVSVADTVEAMTFFRPYRSEIKGIDGALKEITNGKGVLYDADAVETCLKLFREDRFHFD